MIYNIIYGGSSQTMSATSIVMMTIMTIEHFKLYLHHHSKSQRVLCDATLATFAWCSSTFCILCLKRQIAVVRHSVALCKTQLAVNKLDEKKDEELRALLPGWREYDDCTRYASFQGVRVPPLAWFTYVWRHIFVAFVPFYLNLCIPFDSFHICHIIYTLNSFFL